MKKNFIEDIKPLSREPRTPVSSASSSAKPALSKRRRTPSLPREIPFEPTEPQSSSRYALWYIAVICIIGFLFSISFVFERATITVAPKVLTVAFDSSESFTAEKDSDDPTAISYTVMTLPGSETISLPSTQSKVLSDHAIGTVTLYNAYSQKSVAILKNTVLQTADGTPYLTNKAVSIPGYKIESGVIVPGSVDVDATAVNAGTVGNIDSADFTLPKFAKLPQAKKIYGSTKTAFVGGISGTVYTIPQSAALASFSTLSDKLQATLMAKARVEVPDGYIFYDGATVFTTDPAVQVSESKNQNVPIVLNGTLTAYLIKEDTLVNAIATQSINQYNGEPITIPKLSTLTLMPKDGAVLNPDTDTSFDFVFSGSADIIWTINPSDVQHILLGAKKSDFESLIGTIPGVEKAQAVISPFWETSFPDNADGIGVVVTPLDTQ